VLPHAPTRPRYECIFIITEDPRGSTPAPSASSGVIVIVRLGAISSIGGRSICQ
jgi:hypothetical protein